MGGATMGFLNSFIVRRCSSKDNNIPNFMYKAKKILQALGMEYEKIHACPNDCILYLKEFMDASKCLVCETSRWRKNQRWRIKNEISAKVLRYMSQIVNL